MTNAKSTQPQAKESFQSRLAQASRRQWIRFSIAAVCYLLFIIWVGNYWWLLLLPIIADVYLTKYIPWGFWRKSKNKQFRKVMEWVDAIVYALVAVYFINTFFFQNYQIPSSSLEKSLLVGDYLFVSKMSYGPRVPNTPLSFPLAQHTLPIVNTKSYLEWPQWPYKRLKGFGDIERNDIVVFNFPAGDTVALIDPLADFHLLAYEEGKENLLNASEITVRPVDRRENYVKRAVGIPGDIIELRNKELFVNNQRAKDPENLEFAYFVKTSGAPLTEEQFRLLNISVEDRRRIDQGMGDLSQLGLQPNASGKFNPVYYLPLTNKALETARKSNFIAEVLPAMDRSDLRSVYTSYYPIGRKSWTSANYGPIWIPKRGETITLTEDNYPIYERVIRVYEGNDLQTKNGKYYINGKETDQYTFKMDYYWMMGDNRDNSSDSRSWGFVPEDHIVGKPLFVWLSIDKDRDWFDGHIRFNRIFKRVTAD